MAVGLLMRSTAWTPRGLDGRRTFPGIVNGRKFHSSLSTNLYSQKTVR